MYGAYFRNMSRIFLFVGVITFTSCKCYVYCTNAKYCMLCVESAIRYQQLTRPYFRCPDY